MKKDLATIYLRHRAMLRHVCMSMGGLSLFAASSVVCAAEFGVGDIKVRLDSNLSYGLSMRTSSPDCNLIGVDNGGCASTAQTDVANSNPTAFYQTYDAKRINQDDGNLNYKKNALTSSTLKGTHDLAVNFGGGWSSLVRGVWSADSAFKNADSRPELDKDAREEAKFNAQLLDAYVNYGFNLNNRSAKVRVGNQVLSWGEDLFTPGGINSINALDLRRARTPGVQIKEVLLPAPIASFSLPVGQSGSVEAYYQFGWNKTILDPAGSFYSTADSLGKGGTRGYAAASNFKIVPAGNGGVSNPLDGGQTEIVSTWVADAMGGGAAIPAGILGDTGSLATTASIANLGDTKAKDGGQFGLSYRMVLDNDDTWGVYYLRYHEKTPHPVYKTDPTASTGLGGVGFAYAEDRDLFGVSYNTKLGDWTLGTELSYRPKDSVITDPTIVKPKALVQALAGGAADGTNFPYYCDTTTVQSCVGKVDVQKYQWHLTALHNLAPSSSMGWLLRGLGAAEGTVAAELVTAYYPDLDLSGNVPYDVTADGRMPTKLSTGVVFNVGVSYPSFWGSSLTFAPDITYSRGLSGISATGMPGFIANTSTLGAGFTLSFNTRYATQLRFDWVDYAGENNPIVDRDIVSLSLSTSF